MIPIHRLIWKLEVIVALLPKCNFGSKIKS